MVKRVTSGQMRVHLNFRKDTACPVADYRALVRFPEAREKSVAVISLWNIPIRELLRIENLSANTDSG